ncbi:MAG TPA: type 1 glutamine amidotransferase [Actinomycetes bacterium]|nr:type 1 glutamine amidotransferase [Actinomycetes bacterium]
MDVLVIGNREDPERGYVGDALADRGATFREVWRGDLMTEDLPAGTPDVVLVLGSEWHVYDPEVRPAVEREIRFLRQAAAQEVPVLGICFGAQVLARAFGGDVRHDPGGGEVGWYTVDSDDPALPEGPYVQWHSDVFSVPPGAVELARSPVGPQAFALGSAFAVQFHPEVTPQILHRWAVGGHATISRWGLDRERLLAEADERAEASRGHAEALVEAFLAGEFRR